MTENDFNSSTNYYGIENFEDIASLISSGMPFEEACQVFSLTDEQKDLTLLMLARKYYAEERYNLGDKYFKIAERTKNKSELVKYLVEEVRKNKRFYKNRKDDKQKHLSL